MDRKVRDAKLRPLIKVTFSTLAVLSFGALVVLLQGAFLSLIPYRNVKPIDRNVVPPKTLWLADLHVEELVGQYSNDWISVVLDSDPHIVVDVNYSSKGDQLLIEAPMQNKRQIEAVLDGYQIKEDQKSDGSKGKSDCCLTVTSHISREQLKLLVPKVIEACGIKLHDRVDVTITTT